MARGFLKGLLRGGLLGAAALAGVSLVMSLPQPPGVAVTAPEASAPAGMIVAGSASSTGDAAPTLPGKDHVARAPALDSLQALRPENTDAGAQPKVGVAPDAALAIPPAAQLPSGALPDGTTTAAVAPSSRPVSKLDVPAVDPVLRVARETVGPASLSALPADPDLPAPSLKSLVPPDQLTPATRGASGETPPPSRVQQAPLSPDPETSQPGKLFLPGPSDGRPDPDLSATAPALLPEPERRVAPNLSAPDTVAPRAGLMAPDMENPLDGEKLSAPKTDDTVRVNRLPTLGDLSADPSARAPEPADEASPVTVASLAPVERFASREPVGGNKPLMAIVLLDQGADLTLAGSGLPALRNLPYPVSVAVDAYLPDATARMRAFRAAGFEVLASVDFPAGARATDAEVSLSVALTKLPEALAILEGDGTGMQTSLDASRHVAAFLSESGHGLVTQDRGLNTGQRLAARAGVPSAAVFRDVDGKGQSPAVIRRFLDQAAFRAGQQGGVVMLGRLRPETLSALSAWSLQDRAARVDVVPVSRLLVAQ